MTTIKLTQGLRTDIRTALLSNKFTKLDEEMLNRWKEFDAEIVSDRYTKSVSERMEALPKGWLPTVSYSNCHFNGQHHRLNYPDGQRVLDKDKHGFIFDAAHSLSKKFFKLKYAADDLEQQKKDLKLRIDQVLNSLTTVKQLIEVWPEAAPFVPVFVQNKSKQLVVPTETLTKALGLKKAA